MSQQENDKPMGLGDKSIAEEVEGLLRTVRSMGEEEIEMEVEEALREVESDCLPTKEVDVRSPVEVKDTSPLKVDVNTKFKDVEDFKPEPDRELDTCSDPDSPSLTKRRRRRSSPTPAAAAAAAATTAGEIPKSRQRTQCALCDGWFSRSDA
ncbi:hypothetical protein HK101_002142, partial [Irineochytrium annulatum]